MEILDIYDRDRRKTDRTAIRGQPLEKGDFRVVIHVCLFNSKGEMLIQRRQPFTKGWAGMWDVTVSGSAVSGDSSSGAAIRETSEEIGITLSSDDLRQVCTVNFDEGFDDFYIVNKDIDISALTLQPEEVAEVKWANMDTIIRLIDEERFIPYHKSFIEMLFWFNNHSGTITDESRK